MLPCASVHASGHCGAGDRILYSISSMNRTTCSQMHECWRVPGTRAPSQRRRMLRIPNESEDISESVQFCVASRSTSAAYPRVHPSRRYSGMSYSDEPGCTSRLVTLLTILADTAVQHASGSPHMICPLEQGSLAGKHRLVSALRLLLEGAPPWPKRTSCGSPIPRIAPCYRVSGPAPLSGPPLTSRRSSRTGFELHTRCFPKRFSNEFRRRRVSRCVFACDCHQK
jgi:hypothetical protein